MKTTIIGLLALLVAGSSQAAMQSLTDTELDAVQGQALITAGYTSSGNMGFYKVGLQANLEINANIRKLQLGCGGANGASGCDIDIDNFSLSGNCANRPSCDAVMKNPFIEFAVKNPGNSSQREISGFRLSSELLTGLMSAGTNDGTANGINTISGYLPIAASSGVAQTAAGTMTNSLSGAAKVTVLGIGIMNSNYVTDNRGLPVQSVGTPFNVSALTVSGSRMQNVNLTANATVPDLSVAGERTAYLDILGLSIAHLNLTSTVHGLKANMNINEDLGYIHNLPVNSPFSLSLQKESILWPGQAVAAQRGWWMSFSDPIQLGDLSPPSSYRADISSAYPQVASKVSNYLAAHPVSLDAGSAVAGIIGFPIYVNAGTLDLSGYSPVNVPLTNLPLGTAQNVSANCWGSSKFC
jgi:hypothetical protein